MSNRMEHFYEAKQCESWHRNIKKKSSATLVIGNLIEV